jgi:predicted nucleotidyltransferase
MLSRKVPYHLELLYETNLVDIILKRYPGAKAVVLFGSYRKGDDTQDSDVDIAVEIVDDEQVQIERLGVIASLGYRQQVPVNLHVFSRNHININLFNNIANGIVLQGFLEVRP